MKKIFNITFLIAAYCSVEVAFAKKDAVTRRIAIAVSANDGGVSRTKLRYANTDADSFMRVLGSMGGVDPDDSYILKNANTRILVRQIEDIRRRILRYSSQGERVELVFYYSGHSDENGLLLEGEQVKYTKLKKLVTGLPADVRIMILDSCASGSLTLTKGGKRRPAFLLDSSSKTKGHAIITSSSSDEAAQESELIKGSFFTHYLLTGLRGAADTNLDRRVTLNEAYRYAYSSTLARTETTRAGPQHAAYDFQLAGTGDLTLTDLRTSNATILFPKSGVGRYFVRDAAGHLVAEINKTAGKPLDIGVEPGAYDIIHGEGKTYRKSKLVIGKGETGNVGQLTWESVDGEPTIARGSSGLVDYTYKRWSFQLVPDFDENAPTSKEEHDYAFGLLGARSGKLSGLSLALIGTQVDDGGVSGAQISGFINNNDGELSGAQVTAGLNISRDKVSGAQIGAVGNYATSDVTGAQMAAFGNYAGQSITGAQMAGVANYAGENVTGAQMAAYGNYTDGHIAGVQFSGIMNVSMRGVVGVQAAGVANYSERVTGLQAGAINYTNYMAGMQLGVINVAEKVEGMQLGIVNVNQGDSGYSLGLVTYSRNGTLDTSVYVDELFFTHGTLKMGSRYLYTIYDVGARNKNEERIHTIAGFGLGSHVTYGDFDLALEVLGYTNVRQYSDRSEDKNDDGNDDQDQGDFEGESHIFYRAGLTLGYRVFANLYAFAGASYNTYFEPEDQFRESLGAEYAGTMWTSDRSTRWVGRMFGLRYKFLN